MPEILRHKMLEAMVQEESIESLMRLVCNEVQRVAPEVVASILSVDDSGRLRTLAAPICRPATVRRWMMWRSDRESALAAQLRSAVLR